MRSAIQLYATLLIGLFLLGSLAETVAQTVNFDLFVSSRNTHSVKRFNGQNGNFIGDFVQPNSGGLNSTQEVAFGPDGNLYVSGRGNAHILHYDGQTGTFLGNFTSGHSLDNPTKMTFGPDGLIYVSQWGQQQNKVARFDASTGAFIDEFTEIGLNQGCGHAWDDEGNLYVASFGSADVRQFDTTGAFLGMFTEAGHLQGAVNLWFGQDGDLFVVDWPQGAVIRFDGETGLYIEDFITGMQNSEGVTIGPDSLIYICDWQLNRVNRYDQSGNFVDTFISGSGLQQPNSLVFGPPGGVTGIADRTSGVSTAFNLNQNYPNPFNPSTTISFEIPKSAKVSLQIYNTLGQQVTTLLNQNLAAGAYQVEWQAADIPGGIYFYRLTAGDYEASRRLVLLK